MFDKQFLQSLAAGLSRGLSLFWADPEPFPRSMSETEIIRREAREAECRRSDLGSRSSNGEYPD